MNIQLRKDFIQSQREQLRCETSQKGGRLSVQEKINAFYDSGTFVETGAFVSESTSFATMFQQKAEGVVTGYGAVNGRLVFCCIQDYSRDQGALSMAGAEKITALYEAAVKNAAPVLSVFDCDGAKLADGINAVASYGKVIKAASDAKGLVPQISLITGVCSGGLAAVAGCGDIIIMSGKNAYYSVSPVSVLKHEKADDAVGSGNYAVANGLADLFCSSEQEAFDFAKEILNYLPSNDTQGEVAVSNHDDANRRLGGVEALVTTDGYDGRELVKMLADDGKFLELSAEYGSEFIVGFLSVDGYSCGVVANDPSQGKQITASGADKCASFIDLCDRFALPVVTLCDCDGYSAADEAKHPDLVNALSSLALEYASAEVPMVTAIVGKLTGTAFSVLGSKAVGADLVFALPTAVISPMPVESAVEFMQNDKLAEGLPKDELIEKWEIEYASPVYAAKAGLIDYICESDELRARIAAALNMLGMKAAF